MRTKLMLAFALVAARAAPPHLALTRRHVASFVDKWTPQVVGGKLVSMTGVDPYVRAKIAMQNADGALLSEDHDLYLVSHLDGGMLLHACLWGPESFSPMRKAQAFQALLRWHRAVDANASINPELLPEDDREAWARARAWFTE